MFHLDSTGVSNLVNSQDTDGRKIIEFDVRERLLLLGFYETSDFTFHVVVKVIEEGVSTEMKADMWGGLVQINQRFDFSDAENGKDGTMLTDYFSHTGLRIIVRFSIREAHAAHIAITQNIRHHFVNKSENV